MKSAVSYQLSAISYQPVGRELARAPESARERAAYLRAVLIRCHFPKQRLAISLQRCAFNLDPPELTADC